MSVIADDIAWYIIINYIRAAGRHNSGVAETEGKDQGGQGSQAGEKLVFHGNWV
jgi:hypothetical protein